MRVQTLIVNALIAALYFVVTWLVVPFGFTHIQFRLSELFNHFIVFNKKFFFGIVGGVFLANLFFSPMKVDLIFGLAHSMISLLITMFIGRYIKHKITLMWINTVVFSVNMFIIAFMLKVYMQVDLSFTFLWGTSAISEFITMAIAIPIVYLLSKRINLTAKLR